MDTTTETRGERSIPADRLAALYEAERENARLRAALDKIAHGRWNVGTGETRPLREYAARVLRGEAP